MVWAINLLAIVQVLSAAGVILLVLLQHGKGADMGAAFGGGASGSLFGATGSANFLSRFTAILATVFFVSTLVLAMVGVQRPQTPASVMEGLAPAAAPAAGGARPADLPASDVPASDVPASDVPASDVPAGTAPAGTAPAPAGPTATDVPAGAPASSAAGGPASSTASGPASTAASGSFAAPEAPGAGAPAGGFGAKDVPK